MACIKPPLNVTAPSLSRGPLGDFGEALAVQILHDGMQHQILTQHTPGARPQGIDIESLSPTGQVVVTEVKTTQAQQYRPPKMTKNVADVQMDPSWVSKNLHADGQVDAGVVADGHPAVGGDGGHRVRALAQAQVERVYGTICVITHLLEAVAPRSTWRTQVDSLVAASFAQFALRSTIEMGYPTT